jgi:imidazolonepropionase-like amidohydrolase
VWRQAKGWGVRPKNIPLIIAVILAAFVFFRGISALVRTVLPAWPRYGVSRYVRYNAPVMVLTHVRVIDGTGAPPDEDQNVILSNGKIRAMGSADTLPVPRGAEVFDGAGYTVIPGIVGMHDHLFYGGVRPGLGYREQEMASSFPMLYLACGVTTILTTGAIAPAIDLRLKREIDSGWVAGPELHVTGPYMEYTNPEQTRKIVEHWADEGATSFKAYMYLGHASLVAAIEAAHQRGLQVAGHLCAVGYEEAAALGIDSLEHGLMEDTEFDAGKTRDRCPSDDLTTETLSNLDVESAPVQAMIRDLVEHHVAVTSTLPVYETFVPFREPADDRTLQTLDAGTRADYEKTRASINEQSDSPWLGLLKKEMQFERDFVKAGGLLMAGEDPTGNGGNLAGFGDQREIELLVEAGFTSIEAIHIATANGAAFLGESERIGTLEPGKRADVVVLKGDPTSRITDIENVEIVFKDGVGYDSAKMIESVRGTVGLD